MNRKLLTQEVRKIGMSLGFDKIGFAKAEELPEKNYLALWLEKGFHGQMTWMEQNFEKRTNPQKLVPRSSTVISVALNYYREAEREDGSVKISRYAWGDDYHKVLKKKLKSFYLQVQELIPELEGRYFVDTAPISDKMWAVKSGIGWLGKHSNVITRDFGSWVFLGELVVNHEFDYDEEIGDFCGTCERCLTACPTDAIVEPYVVDSNKCIPYLTIELKSENPIPAEFEGKMEGWVFGCDICQDVCPWNIKFAQESKVEEFKERDFLVNPKSEEILNLREEEFLEIFRNNPVKRAKFEGLKRNTEFVTN
ncbi:MAG: tRNA epoxyqueuosine(34) reductase QueG [Calditrichaeota bacterium]|nr:MAG: tRNA epoxyqueuosine(34) reductase QueG [Calditrichota bacterium]